MTHAEPALPTGAPPMPLLNGAGDAPHADPPPPPQSPSTPESPMRRHSDETRAAVRRDVEGTTLPITDIARRHGVGMSTISTWIRRDQMRRPPGAPALRIAGGGADRPGQRARLMARLYTTFGRQLGALEKRAGDEDAIEKDARTLGVLAKTLATLTELDRNDGAKVINPEPADRDLEAIDADLAARIARWAQAGEDR
jgi:transposase-like protein